MIFLGSVFSCCSNNTIQGYNGDVVAFSKDKFVTALIDIKNDSVFSVPELYLRLNKNPIADFTRLKATKKRVIKENGNEFQEYCLDKGIGLYSYSIIGYYQNPTKFQRDYLVFKGKKFLIDSLYWKGNLPEENTFMTLFDNMYKFTLNKHTYLALFSWDGRASTSRPNFLVLLIDYTNPNEITFPLVDYQANDDITCFGDFNSDGNLDYIKWGVGWEYIDTIYSYSLIEGSFIKDPNHFVKVGTEINIGEYSIDFENSNW